MFQNQKKDESQADIDAATVRTLIDLNLACDAESIVKTARRPFQLQTRQGAWTGALLPGVTGAVAVRSQLSIELNANNVISANSRLGRDLSWSLRQTQIYANTPGNLNEFYESLRDEEFFSHNGWRYAAPLILKLVRALGAPDPRFKRGHFTYQEPILGVKNPQVLALSGAVARFEWRAFVLPVVKRLEFADGGHIQ